VEKASYTSVDIRQKIIREYIISVQKEAYHSLNLNPDNMSAFKELLKSIMVQIVLLNRCRAGEVQRILLDTYINAPSEVSQVEISHALSPVELELTKNFKRIVIRGNRGRGVPILFTLHLQKRLTFLLKIRESARFINNENPFLFPLTQCSTSCTRASDVIRKFGQKSREIKNDIQGTEIQNFSHENNNNNNNSQHFNHRYEEIIGDLFSDRSSDAIALCVSECLTMNSGIALQFRKNFNNIHDLISQK